MIGKDRGPSKNCREVLQGPQVIPISTIIYLISEKKSDGHIFVIRDKEKN